MFDDLPPDLERLRTLRVWHAMWVQRIDTKIDALLKRQAEEEHGRRNRPRPPEWIVELGIGARKPPLQVHAGDCYMAGKRRRPVDRDEARRLIASGLKACTHCQPDVQLHIIDLKEAFPRGVRAAGGPRPCDEPVLASRRSRMRAAASGSRAHLGIVRSGQSAGAGPISWPTCSVSSRLPR
ncbi:DUF6233 domain-containing protein [Streptomyces flaveolus]|uniref:DUF6233 domain-containing protein n=1 Tax=Streptomyces flaveolus TaxID=67297 RepID=A0ABV1VJ64_9ACTN